jgi:hypothetical protein
MDLTKELIEIGLGVINLLLIALGTVLWNSQQDAKKTATKAASDLAAHELYCARMYVTNDGLTKSISDLKETITGLVAEIKQSNEEARQSFRDVFSKLNDKQDKH